MLVTPANLNLNFDSNSLQRGKRYFSQGRVQNLVRETEGMSIQVLRAEVSGSQRQLYITEVRFDRYLPGKISSFCSCPVGIRCKHTAAVILQANYEDDLRTEKSEPKTGSRPHGHPADSWLERAAAFSNTDN